MSRRIWYMGGGSDSSTESVADAVETAEGMRAGLASALGISPEMIAQAQNFDRRRGFDRSPTHHAGVAGSAEVKGERFEMVDEHVNAHGERVTEVYRRNESGRGETLRIIEAQAGERTFVVTGIRGGR